MSDAQKHPPKPRVRGRLAPTPRPSEELRVLELEAEVVELQTKLDKAHAVSNDRLAKLQEALGWLEDAPMERDEAISGEAEVARSLIAACEEIRLLTQGRDAALAEVERMRESMKRGGEATARHEQEQRKHLNDGDDQLKIVATLLGISPIPVHGQSVDDWGSDLRDAYEESMRQDAETIYARDIAERDAFAAQLAEAKTRLERLSAMTLFARLRWALAGGEV